MANSMQEEADRLLSSLTGEAVAASIRDQQDVHLAGVGQEVGLLAGVEARLHRAPPRQQLVRRVRVLPAGRRTCVKTGSRHRGSSAAMERSGIIGAWDQQSSRRLAACMQLLGR